MRKIVFAVLAVLAVSCHPVPEYGFDAKSNLKALGDIIERHYCYLDQKRINWDSICTAYSDSINDQTDAFAFFRICSGMLDNLRDGHVNLSSPFDTYYYRRWWSDYPQDFDLRVIQENYLQFDYSAHGAVIYKLLPENVGYMRYSSFSHSIGETMLTVMFNEFRESRGLIIDIRDNGGGDLSNVERLVSRFLDSPITAGYILHKNGPGHSDFSDPFAYTYEPSKYLRWLKPVVVLTNRSTYSAANNFAAIMKTLPHVTLVGNTTGGGGGMPFTSELPCGWAVRFSACPILDPNGNDSENGVSPSPGHEISFTPEASAQGKDPILDHAITFLTTQK